MLCHVQRIWTHVLVFPYFCYFLEGVCIVFSTPGLGPNTPNFDYKIVWTVLHAFDHTLIWDHDGVLGNARGALNKLSRLSLRDARDTNWGVMCHWVVELMLVNVVIMEDNIRRE